MRFGGIVLFAAALAAATALTACGAPGTSTVQDRADLTGTITEVRIDNDAGGVTVTGGPGSPSVERTVSYRGTPPGPSHRVDGTTLVLAGCGYNCGAEYVVHLPAGIPVSGRTSSGAITLSGVGRVDVETSSGAVEIDGADRVRAHTSNGGITGRGLGQVDASTSNGRIDLTLAEAADVTAQTSNGAITVTVPQSTYAIRTDTTNGDTDLHVPNDPAGAHTLDLRTSNGGITVRPG
jgi:hypothetical protein